MSTSCLTNKSFRTSDSCLEQTVFVIDEEIEGKNSIVSLTKKDIIEQPINFNTLNVDLETATLDLDFRVTVLEENGGDDGNSSVAELEVRVETLEGTTADHETRLSTAETDIQGLRNTKLSIAFNFFNVLLSNYLLSI